VSEVSVETIPDEAREADPGTLMITPAVLEIIAVHHREMNDGISTKTNPAGMR
jgi:hypothetical protein